MMKFQHKNESKTIYIRLLQPYCSINSSFLKITQLRRRLKKVLRNLELLESNHVNKMYQNLQCVNIFINFKKSKAKERNSI